MPWSKQHSKLTRFGHDRIISEYIYEINRYISSVEPLSLGGRHHISLKRTDVRELNHGLRDCSKAGSIWWRMIETSVTVGGQPSNIYIEISNVD